MTEIKILVFDFDGTMADTFAELTNIISMHGIEWGIPVITKTDYERFRNTKSQAVLKSLGIPIYKVPGLVFKIRTQLHQSLSKIKAIDGITETLEQLKNNRYKLGILTSNSKENVQSFLISKNIKVFDFIYTSSNLWGKDKALLKMLKELKLTPHEVLYIGDETRDIEAAKKVRIKVCAVTWGFQSQDILVTLKPNFIVNKPEQLLNII